MEPKKTLFERAYEYGRQFKDEPAPTEDCRTYGWYVGYKTAIEEASALAANPDTWPDAPETMAEMIRELVVKKPDGKKL